VADTRPGILAIFNNVARGREAEFEEWFQHEHLHERLAIPDFLPGTMRAGARLRCVNYFTLMTLNH
jgi:hypothetical protein